MTATIASFQPVARKEYLDRLEALPPESKSRPDLWTEVNDEFQEQLRHLETEICLRLPGVQVEPGCTKGLNFFLFSYLKFSMPGSDIDPVVVGMTFTPANPGVNIEADVSGEQTGDVIASVPGKTVDSSRKVLAAVHTMARDLSQSSSVIVSAILDASRRVD